MQCLPLEKKKNVKPCLDTEKTSLSKNKNLSSDTFIEDYPGVIWNIVKYCC